MNNQRGDASSPHGYPENVPNSGFNVQTYVSPTIEDIIDEDAVTEGVAGEDDSGTHTAKYGIVETYGDDNDDDAYVPLHTTASESDDISAGEKDEGHTTDHEEADSDHAPGASLTFHRDTSHIPKHTQNCPTTLFSAINLSHYLKYKIGNALHSTVTGLNHIKNAIKTAVDRLRAILGPNFENAPQIIFNSAKEAVAWIKANPKTTVFIVVCLVGVIVPAIYVIPVLAGAGFGAGGVVAGSLAAGAQASIGASVAAGSTFAILTSAGAGGAGLAAVCGAVQAVAGFGLVTTALSSFVRSRAVKERGD